VEVAFCQHTWFIRNLDGVDLLTGSRGNNLYTLSLQVIMASAPICLFSKASKTKSWLWHRRLSYLNFSAFNHLARQGLVRGLPKHKFEKDYICSACAMGKSTKKSHKSKSEDANQEKLYLLHMDLYGPMRVERVNGKKGCGNPCFTQNRSIIRLRHGKTPYELLHNKLPDLSFLYVFRALCYPANDSENLADSIGSPSSTTVDQDAPSPSQSHTTVETQSFVIPQDVEEDDLDIEVAHMENDPLFGVPILEVTSAQSSSTVSPNSIVQPDHQIPQHNSK
nr:ribonuclease H-like domain-containing protein [Tanacetum cinerariifolium]